MIRRTTWLMKGGSFQIGFGHGSGTRAGLEYWWSKEIDAAARPGERS